MFLNSCIVFRFMGTVKSVAMTTGVQMSFLSSFGTPGVDDKSRNAGPYSSSNPSFLKHVYETFYEKVGAPI